LRHSGYPALGPLRTLAQLQAEKRQRAARLTRVIASNNSTQILERPPPGLDQQSAFTAHPKPHRQGKMKHYPLLILLAGVSLASAQVVPLNALQRRQQEQTEIYRSNGEIRRLREERDQLTEELRQQQEDLEDQLDELRALQNR
jgi:hypothetical protein